MEYFVLHQKKDSARILPAPLCCLYRLAGYPARYVTGYIAQPEEFEADGNGTYTAEVPGKNAPRLGGNLSGRRTGWVPVEMTPGYTEEEEVPRFPRRSRSLRHPPRPRKFRSRRRAGRSGRAGAGEGFTGKLPPALIGVLQEPARVLLLILTVILRRNLVIHMRLRKFKNKTGAGRAVHCPGGDRMLLCRRIPDRRRLSDREYAGKVQEAFRAWNGNSSCGSWNWGRGAAYSREHISAGTAAECLRIYGELEQELSRDRGRLWKFRWRFINATGSHILK